MLLFNRGVSDAVDRVGADATCAAGTGRPCPSALDEEGGGQC